MKRPHRIVYPVPMHRLGRQIIDRFAERFRAAGIATAVYEGRGVSHREREGGPPPDGRPPMCRNPVEVQLALNACADITKTVCGTLKKDGGKKDRGPLCRYRDDCRYWTQLDECAKADVLFLAHNFVFEKVTDHTKQIFANVGTIIIDEDPSAHGDGTASLVMSDFSDHALDQYPVLHTEGDLAGKPDPAKTAELQRHLVSITYVLDQRQQGVPAREALAGEGLPRKLIKQIRGLNWKRQIDPAMWPGQPLDEREEAAERCRINPILVKMHALFSALMEAAPDNGAAAGADELPGLEEDGGGERIEVNDRGQITVYRLRPAADWVAARPLVIASASARPELLEQHFPGLQHMPAPRPAAPFHTVHQHLGAFGREITEKRLPELILEAKALIAGRKALIVTHKPCAEAIKKALPDVAVRYHGGTVGDDDFGDVEVQLVYGGAFPRPKDVRRLASAEAGRILPPDIKPVRTAAVALLADGSGAQFERLAYADEAAQAVHRGIYDGSIEQAIGRGRGLNRTADNPLETHFFGNCPLSTPVNSIGRWRRPSRLVKMLLQLGIVPLNAVNMAWFCAALFPSPGAAAVAMHRWGGRVAMVEEVRQLARQLAEPTDLVTFQPAGQGFKARQLVCLRRQLAERQAEALGRFPDGFVRWDVKPFEEGRALPPPVGIAADDHYIPRKEPPFPEMSWSSAPLGAVLAASARSAASEGPRAPPDG